MKQRVEIRVDFSDEDYKNAFQLQEKHQEHSTIIYILKRFGFRLDSYETVNRVSTAILTRDN